jgi:hypothetical protein
MLSSAHFPHPWALSDDPALEGSVWAQHEASAVYLSALVQSESHLVKPPQQLRDDGVLLKQFVRAALKLKLAFGKCRA